MDVSHPPRGISSAQLYAYVDAGKVGNYRGGFGSGSLASAGGGIRARLAKRLDAGLEIGVPLRNGLDPSRSYKPRLSFTLGARF
jgi:hemolysin activation/secretion protein